MPLRGTNTPLPETVFFAALKPILTPGTQLALSSSSGTGQELVYIQQKYAMTQGAFPAVLLSAGTQLYWRDSLTTYEGEFTALVGYYDRWDAQALSIDSIRLDIALELERMRSNIETYLRQNNGLSVAATVYPVSIVQTQMSGYLRALDTEVAGIALGYRQLDILFTLLPYTV